MSGAGREGMVGALQRAVQSSDAVEVASARGPGPVCFFWAGRPILSRQKLDLAPPFQHHLPPACHSPTITTLTTGLAPSPVWVAYDSPRATSTAFRHSTRFDFPPVSCRLARFVLVAAETRLLPISLSLLHNHTSPQPCPRYRPGLLPRAAEARVAVAEAAASRLGVEAGTELPTATPSTTQTHRCPRWRTRARSATSRNSTAPRSSSSRRLCPTGPRSTFCLPCERRTATKALPSPALPRVSFPLVAPSPHPRCIVTKLASSTQPRASIGPRVQCRDETLQSLSQDGR